MKQQIDNALLGEHSSVMHNTS